MADEPYQQIIDCVHEGRFDQLGKRPIKAALRGLEDWLLENAAVGRAWPADPTRETSARASATYFRRAAILVELESARPGSVSRNVHATLPTHQRLRQLLKARPHREPSLRPEDALASPVVDLVKGFATFATLGLVAEYHLMRTPHAAMSEIASHLATLSTWVDAIRSASGTPPRELYGTRALLRLHQGRLLRAIGSTHVEHAEPLLAEALDLYETRAAVKAREAVSNAAERARLPHYLDSCTWGASRALVQMAYHSFIVGRLELARRTLNTASLLALRADDAVMRSEIDLIALSIRQERLSSDVPRNAIARAARHREVEEIRTGLDDVIAFNDADDRVVYRLMAMYQQSLVARFDLAKRPDENLRASRKIVNAMRRLTSGEAKAPRIAYWCVAAPSLLTLVLVRFARLQPQATERNDWLEEAIGSADEALQEIADDDPMPHLRAHCLAHKAEALLLKERTDAARACLDEAASVTHSAGFTTNAFLDTFCRILGAELLLLERRPAEARQALTQLAHTSSRLEVAWLRDLFHDVEQRARQFGGDFLVSRSELHADQALQSGRRLTRKQLVRDLTEYVVKSTMEQNHDLTRKDMAMKAGMSLSLFNETADRIAGKKKKAATPRVTRKRDT